MNHIARVATDMRGITSPITVTHRMRIYSKILAGTEFRGLFLVRGCHVF